MKNIEEHAFRRIGNDMKKGDIPSVVVLCGSEEYLVDFYAKALIKKYINSACEALDLVTLDRNAVTVSQIIDNLETMPIMSERKVVYLPEFYDKGCKLPKAFANSADMCEALADYMEEICSGSASAGMLLIITCASSDDSREETNMKKSRVFKAASKGKVYEFGSLDDGQLRGFIEKRLHSAGKRFRPGIPSLIARESGYGNKNIDYGLFNLDNDLQKIIAHCGRSEEIMPEDVSAVITTNPENNVFAMIDAVGRNRKDEAFRLLHNLLEDGSSEFQLLSMITKQLELMLTACEMKGEGMGLQEIQKTLKKNDRIHEFRTQKALEAGNRFGVKNLKRILSSAYQVEPNIKTGLMPGKLALEYFIAGI